MICVDGKAQALVIGEGVCVKGLKRGEGVEDEACGAAFLEGCVFDGDGGVVGAG